MSMLPKEEQVRGPGARQAMKAECDINGIMARFSKTGQIAHVNRRSPVYLDISEMSDFRDALEQVRLTGNFFNKLPAKLRNRFNNNPAEFLDFASDEANRPEMEELGLVAKAAKPPVVPPVVPEVELKPKA